MCVRDSHEYAYRKKKHYIIEIYTSTLDGKTNTGDTQYCKTEVLSSNIEVIGLQKKRINK